MAIERTSITDILQLIDAFSPSNQDSQRFENSLMAEFQSGANALNNEDLQFNHNRMKNYYDKNISKMSDEEIEYYESLDDRYKNQMKKNRQFEVDLARKDSFTEGMLDFANKYTAVTTEPNFKEFSYNTTEVIDGKMTNVMRQASAPNPEDFDGGTASEQYKNEYNKFLGQRDEYINSLKNQMQVQMGDYNDYVGKLVNDYAGTGRLSQWDLGELQELDTTYAFIINSFKDNGLIDADEKAVYEAALMQRSSAPIQEFIKKDTEVKSLRREQTYKNMGAYTEMLKGLKSHQNAILNLDIGRVQNFSGQQLNDEFISIEPGTQYNPGEDPLAITYGDILYSMDAIQKESAPSNVEPDIFAYIKDTAYDNATISQLEKELQIQDSSLLKNDGASFLATSEDEYIRGLSDGTQDHRFAFSPAKPTEPVVEKIKIDDKSVSNRLGIQTIDINKDLNTVKTWATPEIKKTGEQLNQIKSEIDNYTTPSTPKLNKLLNKEDNTPISYNELIELEKLYNSDLEEMEKLYNEEQQMKKIGIGGDDKRRKDVRRKIGKLYYKWTDTLYQKGWAFKPMFKTPPESALSQLENSLNLLKSKQNQYNKLKLKYDKDLKRSQK